MAISSTLSALQQAADEGDPVALLAIGDHLEEHGVVGSIQMPATPPEPRVGDWVVVLSATHYWCGPVTNTHHEWLTLGPPYAFVFQTGTVADLLAKGQAEEAEPINSHIWVRRSAIVAVLAYPAKILPSSHVPPNIGLAAGAGLHTIQDPIDEAGE